MSTHSIGDAKKRLPELIDRALTGESVIITRRGRPVAELRPISQPKRAHKVTAAALDWLAERRVRPERATENAGAFVSRMRDEDER
jgi:prevent-host-death family protein